MKMLIHGDVSTFQEAAAAGHLRRHQTETDVSATTTMMLAMSMMMIGDTLAALMAPLTSCKHLRNSLNPL